AAGDLPCHTVLSCWVALVSWVTRVVNWAALASSWAEWAAICSGEPVRICGRKVLGPPEDAVASIAVEFGNSNIPVPFLRCHRLGRLNQAVVIGRYTRTVAASPKSGRIGPLL